MKSLVLIGVATLALGASALAAQDKRSAEDWCRESGDWNGAARACDVREYTVAATAVSVDAGKNGGVRVMGGARTDTLVRARVVATADTQADADALLKQVQVSTEGGKVTASGPERAPGPGRRGWHVSFEVWTPSKADVSARTTNGGISIADVSGTVGFEAVNGGVTLSRVAGNVRGTTVNGGVNVELAGARWEGTGLDARTTNGGVRVKVPDGYSCQLTVATVNGGVRADFPLTVQGRLDKRIEVPLGSGGAPVRISTTNGGVHLTR
jgi:hypothetical protein